MFKLLNMGFISSMLLMSLLTSCASSQIKESGERQVKSEDMKEAGQGQKELECHNQQNRFKYQDFRGTGRT